MIALCPNPFRDNGLQITLKLAALLKGEGFGSKICPVFAEESPGVIPAGVEISTLDALTHYSLAVVIGGDGTILSVARMLLGGDVPVLGVNLGTKGFMASIEPEDIDLVVKAARGEYRSSRRMMLDVKVIRDGSTVYCDTALNDAVIHGYGDCIKLTAWCDGQQITAFSGDGVIVSTPTGSTGYSMSAGGPIVEPETANLILTPICAHAMGAKSFVFGCDRTVLVRTEKLRGRRAYLSVDGISVLDLANGDLMSVCKSEHITVMADLGKKSFYETAFEKLT